MGKDIHADGITVTIGRADQYHQLQIESEHCRSPLELYIIVLMVKALDKASVKE